MKLANKQFIQLRSLNSYKIIRFLSNPKRILWLIYLKIIFFRIPFKTFPSYEHRHILKIIPFPNFVLDIGFNKGQFSSLILFLNKKSIVYAFDPNKGDTLLIANKLIKIFPKRFRFYNYGLGNKEENKLLNIAKSSDNNSFMKPTNKNSNLYSNVNLTGENVEVLIKPLSSLDIRLEGNNNLLKIDVQGYEMFVLQGINSDLYKQIKWIYIEVTDIELYYGQSCSNQIKKYLAEVGFELYKMCNISYDSQKTKVIYSDALYKNININ